MDAKRVGVHAGNQLYTILSDEPGMSKKVKILNRKLCWHGGVGISFEADQKHAGAIIRETGASNLTSLKIPLFKESKEDVRDKTDDIVEKRKLRKLGMKEQPLVGQIVSPAETTRFGALAATANISCHLQRRHRALCTCHANNNRLGEGGEIWEVFEKQTPGSIVVKIFRNAVST